MHDLLQKILHPPCGLEGIYIYMVTKTFFPDPLDSTFGQLLLDTIYTFPQDHPCEYGETLAF